MRQSGARRRGQVRPVLAVDVARGTAARQQGPPLVAEIERLLLMPPTRRRAPALPPDLLRAREPPRPASVPARRVRVVAPRVDAPLRRRVVAKRARGAGFLVLPGAARVRRAHPPAGLVPGVVEEEVAAELARDRAV